MHLVFVLSSVKDISCSASHCAGSTKLTSRWSLMYPQKLYSPPPSSLLTLQSYLLKLSYGRLTWLYTVWIWPTPEDTPGMLSTLIWNAASCCWSRWPSWVPAPLLTSKRRFDLTFADSIPYTWEMYSDSVSLNHFCLKMEEPNFSHMNERKVAGDGQRWAVYLLTQWPYREQLYNKSTCDIITSPWRGDTSA